MRKIISKITVVLSVTLFAISICSVSCVDCLKGIFPLQKTIINSNEILYGLQYGDISFLPIKQIPLFYIGLVLISFSDIIRFTKTNKIRGIVGIMLSLVPTLFVLTTHNYIWFLILMNLYLLASLLININFKNKITVLINIVAVIICILNIIQLIKHLQLTFNLSDIQGFEIILIKMSTKTLNLLWLWLIPYTTLLIKDIITTCKSSRTDN